MNRLAGKSALVTGGGSGIGLAVARLFLGEGAEVAIAGRDESKLRRACEALQGGKQVAAFPADVADPDQVQTLVRQVTDRFGKIDILVNNAGLNVKKRGIRELTSESWRLLLGANLDGAFYCIHAVLPQMLQRRDGVIINVSSVAGKRASPLGGAAYAAAKAGMRALGVCLAAEEKESGIRVSNVYPGEVDTPILQERPQPVTEEQRRHILQPEDVAAAVLFVATLPPRVSVPELVIKPTRQMYV
jgi:NAD(P)-dependent dehydrogenase (short-subunit alcohol dehydrogenase family)